MAKRLQIPACADVFTPTAAMRYSALRLAVCEYVDGLHQRVEDGRYRLELLMRDGQGGVGAVLENDRANQLEWRAEELSRLLDDFPRELPEEP